MDKWTAGDIRIAGGISSIETLFFLVNVFSGDKQPDKHPDVEDDERGKVCPQQEVVEDNRATLTSEPEEPSSGRDPLVLGGTSNNHHPGRVLCDVTSGLSDLVCVMAVSTVVTHTVVGVHDAVTEGGEERQGDHGGDIQG